MSACKTYQRQIALRSVQVLNEEESSALREHLKQCPACRAYSERLQGIVGLFTQDAERPVAPLTHVIRRREAEPAAWARWLFPAPRPAILVVGMLAFCVGWLLFQKPPPKSAVPPVASLGAPSSAAPSVGDSRRLADMDLEDLLAIETRGGAKPVEFVFSVRTRPQEP